ncbi:ABC transporter ATP-binding protein [Paraburkholderia phenazinium]|jgi:ATP-binding cassette subfamily C protein CydC|uniref:ATP-binding cassette, subfamily C, CydCD n=1 Tax=Paraburkholderia phenazinium TaxID=60549 RepID=A0A1G8JFU8_9BURK|nr:ABC transporter ATP-binding protein [Paraburkholderia phenazinium]SDI29951.1 ATP-binding cassette, subfamily C, CydCD [Paraburkholderia phenazinium]
MNGVQADSAAMASQTAERGSGLGALLTLGASRKTLLFLTILSGLVAQAGTVTSIAAGAWLVGRALTHAAPAALVPGFWVLALSVVAAAVARWWQADVSHDFAFALIETLQVSIYDGLERAAPAYVLGRRTGDLASVATADAELMEHFYAHMLGDYIGAIIVPACALIALFFVHWLVALALLPFVPLLASVPLWLAGRADVEGEKLAAAVGLLNADVTESIQGLRELSIFGRGAAHLRRLTERFAAVALAQRRYGSRAGLQQAAMDGLFALAVLTVASVGIWLLGEGRLALGLLPLAIALAGGALMPVMEVTLTARKLSALKAGAERIVTILRQPSKVEDLGHAAEPADATIDFKAVSFGYGGERSAVLRDATFTIRRGETVALVGRSGAGKSTCANLLLRFWDVQAGRISIGGQDLRDLPLATLRKMVSVVPQDVYLFNESVADNIRLGKPEATQAEIEHAARLAQADEFIQALPQGYATVCGERGARLSGGQRQRIAVARAFLRDAPILILDEAASNLDAESERALQIAMDEICRDRTVLVIAHRLSTIRAADRILVIDNGQIVEEGQHSDLVARNGDYARLVAMAGEVE